MIEILRMGMTRGEKNNVSDAVRTLEEHVDDAEEDIQVERRESR